MFLNDSAYRAERLAEHRFVRQMTIGHQPQSSSRVECFGSDGDEASANVGTLGTVTGVKGRIGDDDVVAFRQAGGDVMPVIADLGTRFESREIDPRKVKGASLRLIQIYRGDARTFCQQLCR